MGAKETLLAWRLKLLLLREGFGRDCFMLDVSLAKLDMGCCCTSLSSLGCKLGSESCMTPLRGSVLGWEAKGGSIGGWGNSAGVAEGAGLMNRTSRGLSTMERCLVEDRLDCKWRKLSSAGRRRVWPVLIADD